jgi:hypothetical protein
MPQTHETANEVAARCVDTSNQLRKFLFGGQAIPWNLRRDVATVANLLVDLGAELEEGRQSDDKTAEVLDNTTALGGCIA